MATRKAVIAVLSATALLWLTAGKAAAQIPSAYTLIAHQHQVPPIVLYAVASQESNHKTSSGYRPWPWTLNVAGQSFYYKSKAAACMALNIALAAHSPKRVDVGIAQINLGWNPNVFPKPCDALEPYANLAAAARILRQRYQAAGNWQQAIGHYHYPAGGAIAQRYQDSVLRRIQKLNPSFLMAENP